MAEVYTDITVTLDELYAKGAFSKFTPLATRAAKQVKNGTKEKINERGAMYLSMIELPMNFNSDNFGGNAGADFADAGKVSYLKQTVTALKRMAFVKWQDEVDIQSQSDLRQRPVKGVDEKMQLIKAHLDAYAVSWSRELWGDRTNEMGRVSIIDTGARTVTCASAGNLFGVYNIHIGQNLMFYSSGGTLRTGGAGYVLVTSVNRSNRTFTYSAATVEPSGIIAGDIFYPSIGTVSNKDKALAGVNYMMGASGAYQGTSDRTVNSQLMGTRFAAAGAVLSAAWLRRMLDDQQYYLIGSTDGDASEGMFYASAQRSAYEATELGKQSFAQGGDTLRKGYRRLYFDNAMFEFDPYIPRDAVVYANLDLIDRFVLREYAPVKDQREGGYELPVPSTSGGTYQDNLMVRFRGYEQIGCEYPAKLGVWADGFSTAGLGVGYSS